MEVSDSAFWCKCYIQAIIVLQWFFLQPTERANLYYVWEIYTIWFLKHLFYSHHLLNCKKFCTCLDHTFLVPNKSAWQLLERQWSSLHEERFIWRSISRFISIIFYQLQLLWTCWVFSSYIVILKNFCMTLFGHFWFWVPTCFPEVICPRYDPAFYYWLWTDQWQAFSCLNLAIPPEQCVESVEI